jgi:phenylacetate-CoA ligase
MNTPQVEALMLRNGWKTYHCLQAARAASWEPLERIQQRQVRQLRALLAHAYKHVPMYRQLYNEANFRPESFRSLADLDKIPILSKPRLKAAEVHEVLARGVPPERCAIVTTSGSTGVPLRIYLGPADQRWQRVVAWRILFEHGFRWTDRTLEIRMTLGQTYAIQRLGLAPKDWVSILAGPATWAQYLTKTRYAVVMAGASTLHALAETVQALGIPPPQPRLIVSDSEPLTPRTRHLVHCALGTNPIDVYGLVELSNFAWECEQRCGLHVSSDSHIVEVDAPHGRSGRLIATALGMWTMPIIRYDTGDLAEAETQPCSCGRSMPRLRHLYGRAIDSVRLPDGRQLFWPFFHEMLGRYQAIQQWQILQEDTQSLRLQLVTACSTNEL